MEIVTTYSFLAVLGLVVGSFIASLTWRISWEKVMNLSARSECPKCGHKIPWQDNIPILSFVLLGGRCRSCDKKISLRYPLIELTTAGVFIFVGPMPYLLLTSSVLLAIAVVDLERTIIPDELVFFGFSVSFLFLLLAKSPTLFIHLFWASAASLFLLMLHWLTRGRGMGLGDVKLAAYLGLLAGNLFPALFFVAAVSGAVVGLLLVVSRKAKFSQPIPFGPFLVFGTFVILLFKGEIIKLLL